MPRHELLSRLALTIAASSTTLFFVGLAQGNLTMSALSLVGSAVAVTIRHFAD